MLKACVLKYADIGSCATDPREPCQAGNRAALNECARVPQINLVSADLNT